MGMISLLLISLVRIISSDSRDLLFIMYDFREVHNNKWYRSMIPFVFAWTDATFLKGEEALSL